MFVLLRLIILTLFATSVLASDLSLNSALESRLSRRVLFHGHVKLMREAHMRKYYLQNGENGATPIWYLNDILTQDALALFDRIRQSRQDGLRPREYHLSSLNELISRPVLGIEEKVDIELLLTDSFLNYAHHLLNGRTRPALADPEWHIARPAVPDAESLLAQISRGKSLNSLLDEAAPQEQGYHRLRAALKSYLAIQDLGGWRWRPAGKFLKLGEKGQSVQQLNKLLVLTGDLVEDPNPLIQGLSEPIFDQYMSAGLRRFQLRHGLMGTGIIDTPTSHALSLSIGERIIQIELNLERWRWLPRKLERPAVVVNAPEFGLEVLDEKGRVLSMKVVIGKQLRRTPVFAGKIETVIFNPKWIVPDRIAIEDLLPTIRRNSGMLKRKGIRVYRWKGTRLIEFAPRTIQWQKITADNFDFQFVQDPGPENVQGKFKFVFPNPFGVYLHDTPTKSLFEQNFRTFSSGCIRVENALELAEYLFKKIDGQNWEQIREISEKGATQEVAFLSKIPVYLLYWTAWVGDDNL
ncbi:MAG: L,D-transpeptidase family protein, partial [Bdellovibrionota bacterium]